MHKLAFLLDLFTWDRAHSAVLDELLFARLKFVSDALSYSLARAKLTPEQKTRLSQLDRISETGLHRLLRSPSLCQALRTKDWSAVTRIVDSELFLTLCSDGYLDGWDCMGHVWLGEGRAPTETDLEIDPRYDRPSGPQLKCGIPIDVSLASVPLYPSAGIKKAESLRSGSFPEALTKLNKALSTLGEIGADVSRAVTSMTSNIVLRGYEGDFRSATSALALGRILLVNTDDAHVEVEEVVDALVHESIHTIVSCGELNAPLLTEEVDLHARVRSPWTGAALHIHPFIHACHVWFGLLNLWRAALRQRILCDYAARRIACISAGFDLLQPSDIVACGVRSPALELVREIKERALS